MSEFEYPPFVTRFFNTINTVRRSGTDLDFYLTEIAAASGPVLEIGVGSGRIFIEALKEGADVYGVDVSANMLAELKKTIPEKEHFRIIRQDVKELNLEQKFDLIIAPFRMFSHLLTTDDQLKALNKIHDHLSENGRFIFDVFVPNLKILSAGKKDELEFDGSYDGDKKLQMKTSLSTDIISQLNDISMTYSWEENGNEKHATWNFQMRYYFRYELEYLIRQSKLQLIEMFGDFSKNSLTTSSSDFVLICGKK